MPLPRYRKPESPHKIFERSTLPPSKFSSVDTVLKDLKIFSRRLHNALSSQRTESQILERLYYKSKNQHHSALFWRHVSEVRRFAKRLQEFEVAYMVDGFRATFFRGADPTNPKSMTGAWSQYGDEKYISSVVDSLARFTSLLQKMHERLLEAYKSFSLAMQTGAFIQLILTLAAIVSRMAAIVLDLDDAVQRTIQVLDRLLKVLKDETMLSAPEEVTHVESKDRLLMDEVTLTQTVVPIVVEREHKPEKSSSAANKDTSKKKKKKRDEIDDIFGF